MAENDFGLTPRETVRLRSLWPPSRLQRFLDGLLYDVAGRDCRSPRRVLREGRVQCLDAAIFAAAVLRLNGCPPLILDLEADRDDDHVLAVYRRDGCWGAIARSNFVGLRSREPVFRSVRDLALSFLESYYNLRREKTLRRYSRPVSLARFDERQWMASEESLWYVAEHLVDIRHYRLLTPRQERELATVDARAYEAGLVGRQT